MDNLVPLRYPDDADRVLDLCQRAADYVSVEYQRQPDAEIARALLCDAPPQVPPSQIYALGSPRDDGSLNAFVTFLKGYYAPDEWYMGLLLLDPAIRRQGLGARMAQHVIGLARADGAPCIRVTPLDVNPKGQAFWQSQGFVPERAVTPDDGLLRHIHIMTFATKDIV